MSIKGMKGLPFLLKMVYKGKGLDLKAEPPPVPYTKCSCRESYEEDTVEPLYNSHLPGTEESGHCKEVLNKRQCMDFFCRKGPKESGCCREVAVNEGLTVSNKFHMSVLKITIFWQFLLVT